MKRKSRIAKSYLDKIIKMFICKIVLICLIFEMYINNSKLYNIYVFFFCFVLNSLKTLLIFFSYFNIIIYIFVLFFYDLKF